MFEPMETPRTQGGPHPTGCPLCPPLCTCPTPGPPVKQHYSTGGGSGGIKGVKPDEARFLSSICRFSVHLLPGGVRVPCAEHPAPSCATLLADGAEKTNEGGERRRCIPSIPPATAPRTKALPRAACESSFFLLIRSPSFPLSPPGLCALSEGT